MDPLSLTANIIAVSNAALSATQDLRKLVALRQVPEQILQLQNEVSRDR